MGASRFCRFEVLHSASVSLASETLAQPIQNWDALDLDIGKYRLVLTKIFLEKFKSLL